MSEIAHTDDPVHYMGGWEGNDTAVPPPDPFDLRTMLIMVALGMAGWAIVARCVMLYVNAHS